MISRRLRVPTGEFHKQKRLLSTPEMAIKYGPNTVSHNRFAVIVSAKVDKRSSQRNNLRRTIYEGVIEWPNRKADFVIIVLPGIKKRTEKNWLKNNIEQTGALLKSKSI